MNKKVNPNDMLKSEYLFISYAEEDYLFADWLAKKLTALGYKVWIDKEKLKGGESYPKEFPDIIKNKTFRFLAILSKHSIEKENPLKERTVASNVKKKININDFVIPIKLDDFQHSDLPFLEVDLTYIPFYKNWMEGITKLVQKLESISTPKSEGSVQNSLRKQLISNHAPKMKQEELISNIYKVLEIPKSIYVFKLNSRQQLSSPLLSKWCHYREKDFIYSFSKPPNELSLKQICWSILDKVQCTSNINNIVISLLRKELEFFCIKKGMKKIEQENKYKLIFSKDNLKNGKIYFTNIKGKKTYKQMIGISKEKPYYISPIFRLSMSDFPFNSLTITPTIYWTDEKGNPLSAKSALRKTKRLRQHWWNNKWLDIITATTCWLGNKEKIVDIFNNSCGRFRISLEPLVFISDYGIVESQEAVTVNTKNKLSSIFIKGLKMIGKQYEKKDPLN